MRNLLFILLLASSAHLCKGQSSNVKLNDDYFLLGTLNDYMGRDKYKEVGNLVSGYCQSDRALVFFLDSVFKKQYPDLKVMQLTKGIYRFKIEAPGLAQKMNDCYSFSPSGRLVYSGKEDLNTLNLDSITKTKDYLTKYCEPIYTESIKEDVFKNDTQRLSFLAGAYTRFGGKNDSLYFISIPNSTSKVKVATELLKALKCTHVEYITKANYIPAGHTVYFKPTEELKRYFEAIDQKLAMIH